MEEDKGLAVLVNGFSEQVTPQMIYELFSLCGDVKDVVFYEYVSSSALLCLSLFLVVQCI